MSQMCMFLSKAPTKRVNCFRFNKIAYSNCQLSLRIEFPKWHRLAADTVQVPAVLTIEP